MKNLERVMLALAAFSLAITLFLARPAEARSAIWRVETAKNYYKDSESEDPNKWILNYIEENKYNNKGKQLTSTTTYYSEGKPTGDVYLTTYEYNKKGKIKSEKTELNGKVTRSDIYSYKGKRLSKETTEEYTADGKLDSKIVRKYKDNKIKSITEYQKGSKKYSTKNVYTYKKGKLKKVKTYKYKDKLDRTTTFKYDGRKKTTAKITFKNGKTRTSVTEYTYDKKKLVKEKHTDNDGFIYIVEYNKKGDQTKLRLEYADGDVYEYHYDNKYDTNDHLIETVEQEYDKDDKLKGEAKTIYFWRCF